jgi:hypothetical protein
MNICLRKTKEAYIVLAHAWHQQLEIKYISLVHQEHDRDS